MPTVRSFSSRPPGAAGEELTALLGRPVRDDTGAELGRLCELAVALTGPRPIVVAAERAPVAAGSGALPPDSSTMAAR